MIYVVQGRSELIFIATLVEKDAYALKKSIEGSYITCWNSENGKHLYTSN